MSKQVTAHKFKSVYEDLGYDLGELGCLMLDLENQSFKINESALFYSDNHKYVQGVVANKLAHVTLLYGFLRSAFELKKHIDAVLEDSVPKEVEIDHVDYFESHDPDEAYYCVVAHIKVTPELQEAHDRLTFLPHIETFSSPYKPHMTLCYIKKNERTRDSLIKSLNAHYKGKKIKATGLNYGKEEK